MNFPSTLLTNPTVLFPLQRVNCSTYNRSLPNNVIETNNYIPQLFNQFNPNLPNIRLCNGTYFMRPFSLPINPIFSPWTVQEINTPSLNIHSSQNEQLFNENSFVQSKLTTLTDIDDKNNQSPIPILNSTQVPCNPANKIKNKRKQPNPRKSPPLIDTNFRGVTFNFNLQLEGNESKLTVRHFYNHWNKLPRKRKSSWECDSDEKHCASCGTGKTPLWRDAEDGTPLCNACGIRYKKYRERCINCWRVPRKDGKIRVRCSCNLTYSNRVM